MFLPNEISLESHAGKILDLSKVVESISIDHFDVTFPRILRLKAPVFPSSTISYDEKSGWKLLGFPAVMSLSWGPDSQSRSLEQLHEKDRGLHCVHVASYVSIILCLILETRGSISTRIGSIVAECYSEEILNFRFLKQKTFRIL
jgi:hypothetical protein